MAVQKPPRSAATLAVVSLAMLLIVMDTTIVSVAMPSMLAGFGVDLSTVVWVNSAYLLAFAVPMMVTGRLGDRYGQRHVFLSGLTVFVLAAGVAATAGTAEILIAARSVQGLGAALLTPQTLALLTRVFPATRRGRAMGILGAVSGLGTASGPLLGGVLVDTVGWRAIFVTDVIVGAIAVVIGIVVLPRLEATSKSGVDVVGIALSAAGLVLVILGVQSSGRSDDGVLFGCIPWPVAVVFGAALLGAFVLWQYRIRSAALMPLTLFVDRNFSAATAITAVLGFVLTGMFLPLALYLQTGLGLTPASAGLVTVPMAALTALLGPGVGALADRIDARVLIVGGLTTAATGLAAAALAIADGGSAMALLPGLVICGLGMGLVLVPVNSVAMSNTSDDARSIASGVFFTSRQIGAVLGSAVVGAILQSRTAAASVDDPYGVAVAHASQLALLPLIAALVIGLPAALAVRSKRTET